ncbi:nicotianamine synthase 1 [Quercus suber]|uniref:Nicotianamine synthase n=1 Tax=Quercus suber TaxID=58331 RepID=A0AAW0L9S5_QUESU
MKIHSALRKTDTEKSDFKEEKSETNYTSDQLSLEFTILSQHYTHVHKKIAFVGSGPLPLTSIVLASNHLTKTISHN